MAAAPKARSSVEAPILGSYSVAVQGDEDFKGEVKAWLKY